MGSIDSGVPVARRLPAAPGGGALVPVGITFGARNFGQADVQQPIAGPRLLPVAASPRPG
ncbi:hypothetical protein H4W80_010454 [Nonomuraea angiospora]|uniref:Uncharacterized protein n=1 Tax=Nonomuraea angiospora TaxID=46172 RepID=A0ABR9MIN6_9ACTN|nr:hypothetical protein [Nonomuraea angiospora]